MKARVLELEAANKELSESKEALETSLAKQREASEAVAAAVPAVEGEIAEIVNGETAELIERKEAYDAETEALREQVAILEKKVADLTLENETAQAKFKEVTDLADAAAEDVKAAAETLRQQHAQEIEALKSEQSSNQQKIEGLQLEITALQTRHAEEVEKYLAEISSVSFLILYKVVSLLTRVTGYTEC